MGARPAQNLRWDSGLAYKTLQPLAYAGKMLESPLKLPKRTRRGGRRRNRRRFAASSELLAPGDSHSSAFAWPQLGSRRDSDFTIATRAAPAVSEDESSVCSSLTNASAELERPAVSRSRSSSITSDGSGSPARSRASSFSSVLSSSTASSTASRWWHTRADTDDFDDNISWRTAFDADACPLGIDLAAAARTTFVSSLTCFADAAPLVKEIAVEKDESTDDLFADVAPSLLALVDDVAKAPVVADALVDGVADAPVADAEQRLVELRVDVVKAAPDAIDATKAAPVAAAVVTDDDASDEEAKARAVRRARHEKRRSRNLRKLEHRAARAAQKAAAADAFDAACAEFAC